MSVDAVSQATAAAPAASTTAASDGYVITDISQLKLVNMAWQPLSADQIGKPGIHSSHGPGAAANPDYENNLNRFNQLADVILDESGAYSKQEKLDAWQAQFKMAVSGQLMGLPPEVSKRGNQIAQSSTYREIESARIALMNTQMEAIQRADSAGGDRGKMVAQATLEHIKGMSSYDENVLFASVSPPDMFGKQAYKDVGAWKQSLLVEAGLFAPLDDSVRLDLSEDARGLLGAPRTSSAALAKSYAPGDNASTWA